MGAQPEKLTYYTAQMPAEDMRRAVAQDEVVTLISRQAQKIAELAVENDRIWDLIHTMLCGGSIAAAYMAEQRLRAELAARDEPPS